MSSQVAKHNRNRLSICLHQVVLFHQEQTTSVEFSKCLEPLKSPFSSSFRAFSNATDSSQLQVEFS